MNLHSSHRNGERIVEQIYTGCLAQAAYYLESHGEAAVIDPLRDPQPYIDRAERGGARIRWIFETHFHADFVSGHLELQKRTGATIVYGPSAKPGFPAHVATDGEIFQLGDIRLKLLHTPGHTLESSCYLLLSAEGKANALFTGDTLFLGDVGRPDLAVKSELSKEDLAGKLFDSLHQQILALPDDLILYPGHGAGSACGKHLSKETQDTLGHQKQVNYALRARTRQDFIREVTDGILPPPAYFPENARLNREGYAPLAEAMQSGLRALPPLEFEAAANNLGAVVIDTRPAQEFAKGFIPNSIQIGLDGQFASWVGALIGDLKQPILLVTEPGRESEAISRLTRIGYDHPIGYLQGGVAAWLQSGREMDRVASMLPEQVAQALKNEGELKILDVRNAQEFAAEHIAGAIHFPLEGINQIMFEVDPEKEYLIHCAGGYRSMIAASILKARGFDKLTNIEGGLNGLKAVGFPVTQEIPSHA